MRVRKLSVYGLVLLQAMWGWPAMPVEAQTPAASSPVPAGAPAAVTHHFHRAANGQLYVPAGIPLHLGFGLEGVPLDDGDRETDASKEKSVTLKEGPNQLQFGDVKLPVIADGTPPQTVLEVVDAQNAFVSAENAREDGRVRYQAARADLETLTGTI